MAVTRCACRKWPNKVDLNEFVRKPWFTSLQGSAKCEAMLLKLYAVNAGVTMVRNIGTRASPKEMDSEGFP